MNFTVRIEMSSETLCPAHLHCDWLLKAASCLSLARKVPVKLT